MTTDTNRRKLWTIPAVAYGLVGMVTFGHAAAGYDRFYARECATPKQRVEAPGTVCYTGAPMTAIPAAIFWPLYWSWQAWS